MKSTLLFLVLIGNTIIKAQDKPGISSKIIDTIHSATLKEERYIWVHKPENASAASPVIYVLDGQVHFDEVNTILRRLSKETGKHVIDEMMVVGIGNIWQRYRDYSPTRISSSPWVDSYSASISGGLDQFTAFLRDELFPFIRSKYTSSSTRILIGHSMGGLAVMNILLKHPDMFNYYAALDPSLWWDDQRLLKESKSIFAGKIFEKRALFLAVANTINMDMEASQIKKDTTVKTVLIRPSLAMVDYIEDNKQNKLNFDWRYYKDYHHMTVPAVAMYDALKYFFKFF